MEDLAYWLALLRVPSVGPVTFRRLVDTFGSPKGFFEAGMAAWSQLDANAQWSLANPPWSEVEADLRWQQEKGCHIFTMRDSRYPLLLRQIHDAPPLLYVHGDVDLLSAPQVAIVGSRNPSLDGQQNALEFARDLAARGLVITSGLALGIDAAAHRGALDVGGKTIAVAATGLDRVYPARHRDLAREIADQGALVSEFALGTAPQAENFPRRNRVISGLSAGVLVVEAARHSGSLITARYALEQGREVFALPGSIHNPLARGCHALIREGAKLVETSQDVLEELGPLVRAPSLQPSATTGAAEEAESFSLDSDYQALLDCIGYDPVSIDTLVERSGLTPEVVSSMLLVLELQDYVGSMAGNRYIRTHDLSDPTRGRRG